MKKCLRFILAVVLFSLVLGLGGQPAFAAEQELYLHIGSPIALSDGKVLPLDQENPRLAPLLHHSRTLVPLRMISEYFGATVRYDEATTTAEIVVGGKTARFPVAQSYYTLDGQNQTLDTETLLLEGRTFVPLRVICETVLNLPVAYWDDVVRIGAATLTGEQAAQIKEKIGQYVQPATLDELATLLYDTPYGDQEYVLEDIPLPVMPESSAQESAADSDLSAAAPLTPLSLDAADYSATNIQTTGVDEGDIIKTDGSYIYICKNNQIKIIEARAGALTLAADIVLPETHSVGELYVDGNYLVLTGRRTESNARQVFNQPTGPSWRNFSFVRVYDLSDKTNPRQHRLYEVEGEFVTTRKQGDYLYLLSRFGGYGREYDPRPLLLDGGEAAPVPLQDILVTHVYPAWQLATLSAVNIRDTAEQATNATILDSGGLVYMSNQALYVGGGYTGYNEGMAIARFSIEDGRIGYAGSGVVKGSFNNQFSFDEYQGYLRVATTESWPSANHLFVLDENMDICGQVNGYAPGERIYSVRFLGARGYVVTFREMDPLFVFDLADPQNPRITGELKIPGFSNYLHPVGENLLLGIGKDVRETFMRDPVSGEEIVVGQQESGVKLSLFDVADMGKPQEIATLVLGDNGSTEVLYNHKAAMFKENESLLAFPVNFQYQDNRQAGLQGAILINYANRQLVERGRIAYENPTAGAGGAEGLPIYLSHRTIYIGDTLYFLQDGLLRAFNLSTLEETGRLRLHEK